MNTLLSFFLKEAKNEKRRRTKKEITAKEK